MDIIDIQYMVAELKVSKMLLALIKVIKISFKE